MLSVFAPPVKFNKVEFLGFIIKQTIYFIIYDEILQNRNTLPTFYSFV